MGSVMRDCERDKGKGWEIMLVQRVYVPYRNDVIVCKLIIVVCIVVVLYCKQFPCVITSHVHVIIALMSMYEGGRAEDCQESVSPWLQQSAQHLCKCMYLHTIFGTDYNIWPMQLSTL